MFLEPRPRRLVLLAVAGAGFVGAKPHAAAQPSAGPEASTAPKPPAWRFKDPDRPVKVVSLGGSIAAWPKDAYPDLLEDWCANVEIVDIAKTGLGAWALKRRFVEQVLENRRIDFGHDGWTFWLLLGGTLNSVGMPANHNHHTKRLIELAHRRGMKVVALTPTPWGDDRDRRFRRPYDALRYVRNTRAIADFVLGRSDPRTALGPYARKRPDGPDAPFRPTELPDVAVDLLDAPSLRWVDAPLRDEATVRRDLERDPRWRRAHRDLDPEAREAALAADVAAATVVPRTYLAPALRSFDHIHPNAEGHLRIARLVCPALPASWGCACPEEALPAAVEGEGPGAAPLQPSHETASPSP
ncbi:MAG: hypothetical protein D6705_13690 [Deltaproteobacteria bacterium]|nr:MAG: hypothetical protein D6705_13690 [Deltaproteobacteria bacterium]